jgi:hypothetical protein
MRDLITDAYLEAGIFAAGETPSSEDMAWGLRKARRLFDLWNADDLTIFANSFLEFILVPNVQPLTIGQAAPITQASLTGNVVTYLAKNSFSVGDFADVYNCTNPVFNITGEQVIAATPTSFQVAVTHADIAPEAENGALAVYTDVIPPNYALPVTRPTKILNANIVLNNVDPIVKVPLVVHNNKPGGDWWSANSVPTVPTTIPTDLYYSADFPNGSLYLWPLQTTNYGLELEVQSLLADLSSLDYTFFLPQGYQDGVTYSLAESVCPGYGREIDPGLRAQASNARAKIKELNSDSPMIITRDPGLPRGSRNRTYFNWLNGQSVPPR